MYNPTATSHPTPPAPNQNSTLAPRRSEISEFLVRMAWIGWHVGGWTNMSEKYESNWKSFPNKGWTLKNQTST